MTYNRTSGYDTRKWLLELRKRGIETYIFRYLPEDLHIEEYHKKAAALELIFKTGNRKNNYIEWKLKKHFTKRI